MEHKMQQYIGTKHVKAEPMNRRNYNKLRGWQLPANENGADEGYLVEYTDGGKPNTETHAGYVSWSPKEQFEKAYKLIDPAIAQYQPWQQRVLEEKNQLAGRLIDLQTFINIDAFKTLDRNQQSLLEKQAQLMYELKVVLDSRIASFEK